MFFVEGMESRGKFEKTTIPPKEAFYSELNLEGISDADYAYIQKLWKILEIKNCSEYHDCMFSVIHYCLQMFLKTLDISVLKYMNLILRIF